MMGLIVLWLCRVLVLVIASDSHEGQEKENDSLHCRLLSSDSDDDVYGTGRDPTFRVCGLDQELDLLAIQPE